MKPLGSLLLLLALAAPAGALAKPPVVVELFTAQGCASCAKVEAAVDQLVDQPGLVVLTWPVDYWDYLGWKDTAAKPEFTERQQAYDRRFGLRDVYTPQVVVDGRLQGSGSSAAIESLVREARRTPSDPPDMALMAGGRIAVGSGPRPRGGAEVWLVRYERRPLTVEVKAGDNRGQTVTERNVVHELARLGEWKGRAAIFKAPPAADPGLATLFIVQIVAGGRILTALEQDESKP